MICKTCNREIDDNSKFCVFCGANVEQEIYLEPEPMQPIPKRRRLHPAIIVLIVIGGIQMLTVLVIAIIAVVIGILNANISAEKAPAYIYEGDYSETIVDNAPQLDYDEDAYDTEEIYNETENEAESAETDPPETDTVTPVLNTPSRVVIANGGLNMRSGPSTSESVITLIPNGDIVVVDETEGNWAYVYYNGNYGWCSCDYLFVPIEYTGILLYSATVRCDGYLEMISYDYIEDDEIFTDVPNGTHVDVYKVEGDRAFIKYNNIYGWCLLEYLELM